MDFRWLDPQHCLLTCYDILGIILLPSSNLLQFAIEHGHLFREFSH